MNWRKLIPASLKRAAQVLAQPAIVQEEAPKVCRCGCGKFSMLNFGALYVCEKCGQRYQLSLALKILQTDRCPDCGGRLLKGPSGGCSVNYKCENAEHYFNISFLFEDIVVERIRR